ncbi:MAG: D-tyrosyl-tRNA(Tyr) deacylase [Phycisphaerae bacterium]|nr:D-tyrosyl-tRNA(Tyr) deacylase [Phycisphaerae bacterium]MBM89989.1 D-tyrosyl-tRNA(Tyr) deacylase [Phycisphaerae bacterium]HCT44981.1 D-tyrosyl-tRNA(Tyr) deacylase [Phycisphaerales bacterium]
MRAVIQRVEYAKLHLVDEQGQRALHTQIGIGLVVLLGIAADDAETDAKWIAGKIAHMRIFEDENQKMNLGALDHDPQGQVLVVPNFTVAGQAHKGRRPDFTGAMKPPEAEQLFERVCELIAGEGLEVQRGVFGGDMRVELVNDGPVTIVIESP